jgi:alpha-mannosidase
MKKIHLICNAHLDPVWLWEWEEGAAEAISTFRVAADFCEAYDGFVFNHNEVILYKWVEEYEPLLFKRIQALVGQGKWHIMGGWYLQPDCNMPCGESFVRQILVGRQYFKEKFGVEPTTAINFDPFGHSRGLVQIMKKSGYDSYVFCRPDQRDCQLPAGPFHWVGYDGSQIMAHRAFGSYLSLRGQAAGKVSSWMKDAAAEDSDEGMILWGVGNHGGGPSKIDLEKLNALMAETKDHEILHSTPEAYFQEVATGGRKLPEVAKSLNHFAVGCYTSQVRVKQRHRSLENELFVTEKMLSTACANGLLAYPSTELGQACEDLLTAQFHDILPGSSIQPVEEASLRLMDHGLEILSRLKARAFFALASGQAIVEEGEIPIFVYNPHPYPISGIFACEFQLADQNWKDEFSVPVVYQHGEEIASQVEQETSSLNLDWRKCTVFSATLAPGIMNRFICKMKILPKRPIPVFPAEHGRYLFENGSISVSINCETGLMDSLKVGGCEYFKGNAFLPLVIEDSADPWGMQVNQFRDVAGPFCLMGREEGTGFSGIAGTLLESVRVIEDGAVRTVVEAVFRYGDSFVCQRYKLPKRGAEIEVEVRVFWNEKKKMLKLSIPTTLTDADYLGQTAYGVEKLLTNGQEVVAQKWVGLFEEAAGPEQGRALTCINDGVYGSDCRDGEIRLSLLRSPGYSAHPIGERPVMPQDRFSSHIDQGERLFSFRINAGNTMERLAHVDREALAHHEKPFALSFFPSGLGVDCKPVVTLEDDVVQMTALKKAEDGNGWIIRLYNPTGAARTTRLAFPVWDGIGFDVALGCFEVKSFRLLEATGAMSEVDLMEQVDAH